MTLRDFKRLGFAAACVVVYCALITIATVVSGHREYAVLLLPAIPMWLALDSVTRRLAVGVSIAFVGVVLAIVALTQVIEFMWALCLVRAFSEGVTRLGLVEAPARGRH